jgi:uncharacterized protein (TIGR03086 family)
VTVSRGLLDSYRRAQDRFDEVLRSVPADRWDAPSACELWTVRDVIGHVIWGQEQLAHWATGQNYSRTEGAPGARHPAEMAGSDPVATWRTARAAADESLTDETLRRTVTLPGLGETPLSGIVTLLVTDLLAHSNVIRVPGFFGPELTAPPDADEQTRWLAYLGRTAWQPVAA